MDFLAVFIPLLPLLAAMIIGVGHLFDKISGREDESITVAIARNAIVISRQFIM